MNMMLNNIDSNYNASYKIENYTDNFSVVRDRYSCIIFNNTGTSNATINGFVVEAGESISFVEKPYVFINTDFQVNFDKTDPNATHKISVIKTYYRKIKEK